MTALQYIRVVSLAITLPAALAGQGNMRGSVLAEPTRAPIVGANLVVKGTLEGGATDDAGRFNFPTSQAFPLTLQVSHIGFRTLEVVVTGDTTLEIVMIPAMLRGEDIVVTGKQSRAHAGVSSALEVVTVETIESLGARDVGDVLRPLPSVSVRASATGKQTVSIRGSNPNEVAIFLDGLRLNSANNGVVDLSAIDLNELELVEVIKGGATTLFGQGAFGGVVILTSRPPDSNRVAFFRGYGLTDDGDQDLSVSASGRLGPIAAGGRFSGKSRRYDGSVLNTNLFRTFSAAAYARFGEFAAKQYDINNLLELPNKAVAQSDHTTLSSISYDGSILGSPDWALFLGGREWDWQDRFFTNLERNLAESGLSARITKQRNNKRMSSTFQIDYEEQSFSGDNTTFDPFAGTQFDQSSDLTRTNLGYSAVIRFLSEDTHAAASKIRWELSLRGDQFDTRHDQERLTRRLLSVLDTLSIGTLTTPRSNQTWTRRMGFHLEGSVPNLYYTFFVNQGRNQRLPSLSDLFLWANEYGSVTGSAPLHPEYLSTTDFGVQFIIQPPTYAPQQLDFRVSADLFLNQYSNKLTYRYSTDSPPVPFNTLTTRVSGYDFALEANLWDRRLNAQWAYQRIHMDDPQVFPNKPESRMTYRAELRFPWLTVAYDFYRDGPQVILVNGFVISQQINQRESANLNVILRLRLWRAKMSLAYTVRNLFSQQPAVGDQSGYTAFLPFQYYEAYRQILTFRVSL